MFTVEIKINGSLIGHIYGQNVTHKQAVQVEDFDVYDIEYYRPESHKLQNISIRHHRKDGIEILVRKILEKVK